MGMPGNVSARNGANGTHLSISQFECNNPEYLLTILLVSTPFADSA
jgi:hypothetical protein